MSFTKPDSNITRKSSQRIVKTAIGRGGNSAPNPGRNPGGANGMQSSAVSSISRSSWAEEKSAHVATNDRKTTQQIASVIRGHQFKTSATAAASPPHASVAIRPVPVPNQNRLGA